LGVIKVHADALDKKYLQRWAEEPGVVELLEKALRDAGVVQ
jgi:hypothetical protein